MKQLDLNFIPEKIKTGELSKQQAINELVLFIEQNSILFGLTEKNKDLKSEIILYVLEKGYSALERYNPDYGSFFTYFFCYIKNIQVSLLRKKANKNIQEYHYISEYITNYGISSDSYDSINYSDIEKAKVPYNYKKLSPEELKIACKSDNYKFKPVECDSKEENRILEIISRLKPLKQKVAIKTLMVLALKAAFYITDSQINMICKICGLDKTNFQTIIQSLKDEIIDKQVLKEKIELRRNNAYYMHKKLKNQLEWDENEYLIKNQEIRETVIRKYNKYTENWLKLNKRLNNGVYNIRPTNKAIANALGICERQVSYYIKTAEKLNLKI